MHRWQQSDNSHIFLYAISFSQMKDNVLNTFSWNISIENTLTQGHMRTHTQPNLQNSPLRKVSCGSLSSIKVNLKSRQYLCRRRNSISLPVYCIKHRILCDILYPVHIFHGLMQIVERKSSIFYEISLCCNNYTYIYT